MHEPIYYYSHSSEEFRDIMEMHLIHFIRAFKKLQDQNNSIETTFGSDRDTLIKEILEQLKDE